MTQPIMTFPVVLNSLAWVYPRASSYPSGPIRIMRSSFEKNTGHVTVYQKTNSAKHLLFFMGGFMQQAPNPFCGYFIVCHSVIFLAAQGGYKKRDHEFFLCEKLKNSLRIHKIESLRCS